MPLKYDTTNSQNVHEFYKITSSHKFDVYKLHHWWGLLYSSIKNLKAKQAMKIALKTRKCNECLSSDEKQIVNFSVKTLDMYVYGHSNIFYLKMILKFLFNFHVFRELYFQEWFFFPLFFERVWWFPRIKIKLSSKVYFKKEKYIWCFLPLSTVAIFFFSKSS